KRYQCTVLLKGETDHITDGFRNKKNDFGTPAMTVGGTGDTLAGVVSALLSKGMSTFDASRLGAYITCRAGELAFEEVGWGMMPEDISEKIPDVLKNE
ncbi:MAG: ADP-dependent NAD(P)H-hydrate dehydratase, partial [Candidatus Saliniplasma sp.]